LPTHRELADKLGVATGTITRAYTEAERRGLIHGEGRRGTIVGESPRGQFSLSSLMDAGSHIVDLSKNYPTYSEDPDLLAALRHIARRPETQQLLQYPHRSGAPHHRVAGAAWMRGMGLNVDPDAIQITAGAQHGLAVVLPAVSGHGDTILAEEYTYPGVKAIAEMFGFRLVGIPMDVEGLIPEALESMCKQRQVRALFCNPTFQNPTGIVYTEERRRQIAEIAEKYDFIVVEDDIMRPLLADPPPLISSLIPNRSCLIASTSKVLAAGLRVGFIAAPAQLRSAINDCLRATTLVYTPLTAEVVAMWTSNGVLQQVLKRRRTESRARQLIAEQILHGHFLGTHPVSSIVWLGLTEPWTTTQFTMEAQRRGVAVVPAETFAVSRTTSIRAVRLCLGAAPSRQALKTGLQVLAEMLKSSPRHDVETI
jgi:DNA-binding transcriptional MocR family regulator